jgi:hypothetical protein
MIMLAVKEKKLPHIRKTNIEADERTPSLGTLAMVEFVKQRRIDALRIKELTLRAVEALEKPNNNNDTFCEKSVISSVRD